MTEWLVMNKIFWNFVKDLKMKSKVSKLGNQDPHWWNTITFDGLMWSINWQLTLVTKTAFMYVSVCCTYLRLSLGGVLMLVAVCRDHKVRVWNLSSSDCIMCTDLVQYLAEVGREMHQGTQHHKIATVKQVTVQSLLSLSVRVQIDWFTHSFFR